jgi:hypothetical protein
MLKRILVVSMLLAPFTASAQPTDSGSGSGAPPPTEPAPATGGPFMKGTLGFSLPVATLSEIASSLGEPVPTIDILYFLSDKAAVDLIAGVNFHYQQRVDNNVPPMTEQVTVFGFAAGLGYRMYKHKGALHSFIEPQGILGMTDSAVGASFFLDAGLALGAERTFGDWFSVSGAFGGALRFTNKFNDIQAAPTASLAANFYWK